MGFHLSIRGEAKIVKIYNVTRLNIEGIDISTYNLEDREEIIEFFEIVNDFVESGEADVYEMHTEIHGVEPETCKLKITNTKEIEISLDEITLKNRKLDENLQNMLNANVGEIFFVKTFQGEALWDFDSDIDEENIEANLLELGYLDCSFMDKYEIMREDIYDLLCDTVTTDYIRYRGEGFELLDFVFHPIHIFSELYIVKEDPILETKILQKVESGGRRLAGTDIDVDDLENN